jgi:hypothetical protein
MFNFSLWTRALPVTARLLRGGVAEYSTVAALGAPTLCEPFRLATTSYAGYFFALWWTRSMISLMATAHISPHSANIAIHVACGSAALCLGLIAILSRKGGPTHIRAGRLFIYSYGIVVATAVIGLAILTCSPVTGRFSFGGAGRNQWTGQQASLGRSRHGSS